jgi:predicted glycosyltransferase
MTIPATTGQKIKIALYCHNRDGLGHIIRSLYIAKALAESGQFDPALLTGCRALSSLTIPPGVAIHQLTPIPADRYAPNMYEVLAERVVLIRNYIESFAPDIVLVDCLPFGYMRELKTLLDDASRQKKGPVFILGLPYPPFEIEQIFKNPVDFAALSAYRYGLIYSDADEAVYERMPFPLLKTGLVGGAPPPASDPLSKVILVLPGGGTTCLSLIDPVVQATVAVRKEGFKVRFVAGPLADQQELQALLSNVKNFELVATATVEEAVRDARLVIARSGYNTAAALIQTTLPIIFIPYCRTENDEQFVRAKRLSAMANIVMIDPHSDNVAVKLEDSIRSLLLCEPKARIQLSHFSGATTAMRHLAQIASECL